jgi:hypothetical protein
VHPLDANRGGFGSSKDIDGSERKPERQHEHGDKLFSLHTLYLQIKLGVDVSGPKKL